MSSAKGLRLVTGINAHRDDADGELALLRPTPQPAGDQTPRLGPQLPATPPATVQPDARFCIGGLATPSYSEGSVARVSREGRFGAVDVVDADVAGSRSPIRHLELSDRERSASPGGVIPVLSESVHVCLSTSSAAPRARSAEPVHSVSAQFSISQATLSVGAAGDVAARQNVTTTAWPVAASPGSVLAMLGTRLEASQPSGSHAAIALSAEEHAALVRALAPVPRLVPQPSGGRRPQGRAPSCRQERTDTHQPSEQPGAGAQRTEQVKFSQVRLHDLMRQSVAPATSLETGRLAEQRVGAAGVYTTTQPELEGPRQPHAAYGRAREAHADVQRPSDRPTCGSDAALDHSRLAAPCGGAAQQAAAPGKQARRGAALHEPTHAAAPGLQAADPAPSQRGRDAGAGLTAAARQAIAYPVAAPLMRSRAVQVSRDFDQGAGAAPQPPSRPRTSSMRSTGSARGSSHASVAPQRAWRPACCADNTAGMAQAPVPAARGRSASTGRPRNGSQPPNPFAHFEQCLPQALPQARVERMRSVESNASEQCRAAPAPGCARSASLEHLKRGHSGRGQAHQRGSDASGAGSLTRQHAPGARKGPAQLHRLREARLGTHAGATGAHDKAQGRRKSTREGCAARAPAAQQPGLQARESGSNDARAESMVFRASESRPANGPSGTAEVSAAPERKSSAAKRTVATLPGYGDRLRLQAREQVPHGHDRLFAGFESWTEVSYFTLQVRAIRTRAGPLESVYVAC